ncbi:hypothetical protein LIER_36922 [Lithospermum erythrorhizon]|uniref:WEB family protein n=1 Tax=Lithospermum erythrorhizon TaxID=34254 RepID=A0AAV3PGU3_LITER
MAESETATEALMTETIQPRVEIDTSPPFESVKEAVSLFSRGRAWIPSNMLPPEVDHLNKDIFDVNKMEEHTAQLERVLINRERETLDVLKELEETKHLVEDMKLNLAHGDLLRASPNVKPESELSAPNIVLTDLDHARVSLHKTWIDLAVIRASAESLNKKMKIEAGLLQTNNGNKIPDNLGLFSFEEDQNLSREMPQICHPEKVIDSGIGKARLVQHSQFNFETEQFKKMVEASRYETMKAMSEIERTKVCIRMAELRLDAARKIEEAAKAVEAIALAERQLKSEVLSPNHLQQQDVTLSFEEYNALILKAKQAELMFNTDYVSGNSSHKTKRATQFSEAGFRKREQKTTFKRNSLEAFFGNDGIFRREDLEGSTYNNLQDSRFSSATPKFQNMHQSVGQKDSCLLNGTESGTVEEKTVPVCQSTISFGDILRRKLILQDDFMLRNHAEYQDERQQVSQSEIIRKQSGLIFHHTKSTTDERKDKHYFEQKKKFGFIHVVLPKHRKKTQS